jgi:hypothetical protein
MNRTYIAPHFFTVFSLLGPIFTVVGSNPGGAQMVKRRKNNTKKKRTGKGFRQNGTKARRLKYQSVAIAPIKRRLTMHNTPVSTITGKDYFYQSLGLDHVKQEEFGNFRQRGI